MKNTSLNRVTSPSSTDDRSINRVRSVAKSAAKTIVAAKSIVAAMKRRNDDLNRDSNLVAREEVLDGLRGPSTGKGLMRGKASTVSDRFLN